MTPIYKRYIHGDRKLTDGERQRRYMERLARTNPEAIEIRKQRKREYDAFYRERIRQLNGIRQRQKKTDLNEGAGRRLPAAPMCAWARAVIDGRNMSFTELAKRCDVNEKTIRNLYTSSVAYISEGLVDRMLTSEGSSLLLEIYPELYA
jgi:hypothetical protein